MIYYINSYIIGVVNMIYDFEDSIVIRMYEIRFICKFTFFQNILALGQNEQANPYTYV